MLKVHPLPAPQFGESNYIWMLQEGRNWALIDPTDADTVLRFLGAKEGDRLTAIYLTHHHLDHTAGVAQLQYFYPGVRVQENHQRGKKAGEVLESFSFAGHKITQLFTGGHTLDHVVYRVEDSVDHIFCGDVLFSCGCGRVDDGSLKELFAALNWFKTLPEETLFYPAHEYTRSNLAFARNIDQDNPDIVARQQALVQIGVSLPTSLQQEKKINPFLRLQEQGVLSGLKRITGQRPSTEYAAFCMLRQLKNAS